MKTFASILLLLTVCFSILAQKRVESSAPFTKHAVLQPKSQVNFKNKKHGGGERGAGTISIVNNPNQSDSVYFGNNVVNGEYIRFVPFRLGSNLPLDSFHNGDLRWVAEQFDTLIDIDYNQGYTMNNTPVTIDSIYYAYTYQRQTAGDVIDTLIINIYQGDITLNVHIDSGAITNIILHADTLLLRPSDTVADGYLNISPVYPHYTFATPTKFSIGFDFRGDTTNHFYMIGGYGESCNNNCAAKATGIPGNTQYDEINYLVNPLHQYSSAIEFIFFAGCGTTGNYDSTLCELNYLQDLDIYTFMTIMPQLGLTLNGPDTDVCTGNIAIITANAYGGTGNYTYQWSNNYNSSSITVSAGGNYTVTVSDGDTTISNSFTVKFINCPQALHAIITGVPYVCNSTTTLAVNASGGSGDYFYRWSNSATASTINVTLPGVYTVTVYDGITSVVSGSVTVTSCGGNNNNCDADTSITQAGIYPVNNSIPCIIDGQAYYTSLTLKNFDSTGLNLGGGPVEIYIDSMTIDSIVNLPCGIAWQSSEPSNTFGTSELGCIKLFGVTNDLPGQYEPVFYMHLYFDHTGQGLQVTLGGFGSPLYLRVKASSGANCPDVDTNLNGNTASCSPLPPLNVTISGQTSCDTPATMLIAIASGGNGNYSYYWTNGATTATITTNDPGIYTVVVTDGNGRSGFSSSIVTTDNSCKLVWPGDANDDGIVDYNDILQIALIDGSSGPTRNNASIQWVGQAATDWDGITNGLNYKFGDCDGNGIINFDDTLAVTQNYSLTHNKTGGLQPRATDPVLTLVPETDSLLPNNLFKMKIMLGTLTNPVDSLYGLAFSIGFNPAIFDTNNVQLSTNTSWLGNSVLSFRKVLTGEDQLVMVLSKTDHSNIEGNGQIGELTLATQSNLPGNTNGNYMITPNVLRGITATASPETFNVQTTQVTVFSGINNLQLNEEVNIYPNPNNGHFKVTIDKPGKQLTIELLNIEGRLLYTEQLKDMVLLNKDYDFSYLAKGIYLLKISNENGVAVKRLVVQ